MHRNLVLSSASPQTANQATVDHERGQSTSRAWGVHILKILMMLDMSPYHIIQLY